MCGALGRNPRVHGINRRVIHLVEFGHCARRGRVRFDGDNRQLVLQGRAVNRNGVDLKVRVDVVDGNFNAVCEGDKRLAVDKNFVLDGVGHDSPKQPQNVSFALNNRRVACGNLRGGVGHVVKV